MGLSVVGGAAQASFELVMVADNGSGTFASRKIHRFDGDSGVYLGSFGGFGGDIIGTHLNQTTNSMFVFTSDSRMAEYNYNTGALVRSYSTPFSNSNGFVSVRPNQSRAVYLDGTDTPKSYAFPNVNGGINTNFQASGLFLKTGVWLDNNRFFAYADGPSFEWAVKYNVTPDGLSGTVNGGFLAASNLRSQMSYLAGIDTVVHPGSGYFFLYNPTSNTTSFVETPGVQNRHSTLAHDGFFTMGNRGGTWSLDKYDATFGQRGQYAAGMVLNPASMQSVVAPEPGTMIALGAGVAVLLRRRRRSPRA